MLVQLDGDINRSVPDLFSFQFPAAVTVVQGHRTKLKKSAVKYSTQMKYK